MKLTNARITNFKSINDSGDVEIDEAITCLVGRNEAGKSAWMRALARLMPTDGGDGSFNAELEFPRSRIQEFRDAPTLNAHVVEAAFDLDDDDIAVLQNSFGVNPLSRNSLTLTKGYETPIEWKFDMDDAALLASLRQSVAHAETESNLSLASNANTWEDLVSVLADESNPDAGQLREALGDCPALAPRDAVIELLEPRVPRFLYFSDYSRLQDQISIPDTISRRNSNDLTDADKTFLALLHLSRYSLEEFGSDVATEARITNIEAASKSVTEHLQGAWSQGERLRVKFQSDADQLSVRIEDTEEEFSIRFSERSDGFAWFFSFYTQYLSWNTTSEAPLVLLLDEPGLHLHASAQADFLRMLDSHLDVQHQVIFSTHSPFMIDADRLDRIRVVEHSPPKGTRVRSDVLRVDRESFLPLQAALGYTLSQTLFTSKNIALVEGVSDLRYLRLISEYFAAAGEPALDPAWVVVPTGGAGNMSTFLSLMNQQVNVVAIVDGDLGDHQRLQHLCSEGVCDAGQIISLSEIAGMKGATIEDLFDPDWYSDMYAAATGSSSVALDDKTSGDRILSRLHKGKKKFNHDAPATHLAKHRADLVPQLSTAALDRWAELIQALNQRLS